MTTYEAVAIILTALSFLAMVAMVVLNLKVKAEQGAIRNEVTAAISSLQSSFQREISLIQIQVSNMRGDLNEKIVKVYQDVVQTFAKDFMRTEMAQQMHDATERRLSSIESNLERIEEKLGR